MLFSIKNNTILKDNLYYFYTNNVLRNFVIVNSDFVLLEIEFIF